MCPYHSSEESLEQRVNMHLDTQELFRYTIDVFIYKATTVVRRLSTFN